MYPIHLVYKYSRRCPLRTEKLEELFMKTSSTVGGLRPGADYHTVTWLSLLGDATRLLRVDRGLGTGNDLPFSATSMSTTHTFEVCPSSTLTRCAHSVAVQQEQQSKVSWTPTMQRLDHHARGPPVWPGEFRPVWRDRGMAALVSRYVGWKEFPLTLNPSWIGAA